MSDPVADLAAAIADPGNDDTDVTIRQGVVQTLTATGVTLTLGGSNTPVPAKYLSSYAPVIGDTVFCLRFGSDLLVVGNTAGGTSVGPLPNNGANAQAPGSQSNSTATFQNVLTSGGATFGATVVKRNTASALLVQFTGSAFSSAVGVVAQFIAFDTIVGGAGVYALSQYFFNAANDHRTISGQTKLIGVPAGARTIIVQFRNIGAAGNVTTDPNDWFSLSVTETAT